MARPRKVVEGEASASPSAPSKIKVLEDRTIAHGSGLMTFRKGVIYDDPWYIGAAVSHGILHEPE